jgi:hypothetical protein
MLVVSCTAAVLVAGVAELVLVDAIYSAIGEPLDGVTIGFHFLVIIAIPVMWWLARGFTKITALVLSLCLLMSVPRAKAAPALALGALLVIVAGGVIGCKVVKRCNRIAKGRTNAVEQLGFEAQEETAALFTWTEGYCFEQRLLPTTPTVMTMCPEIDGSGINRMLMRADVGGGFTETWPEFVLETEAHGLEVSRAESYSKNGVPCSSTEAGISFNATTKTATIGNGGILVNVDRSTDLKEWTTVMTLNVESYAQLRIEDVGEDKMFYRIVTKAP